MDAALLFAAGAARHGAVTPERVFIGSDHPILARGLGSLLQGEGFTTPRCAGSKSELKKLVFASVRCVAVLAYASDPDFGLRLAASLRAQGRRDKVVVLCERVTAAMERRAQQLGAVALLRKTATADQIIRAIEAAKERSYAPEAAHLAGPARRPRGGASAFSTF
jgi:DNA-binding NarL/FixJ family response regulator